MLTFSGRPACAFSNAARAAGQSFRASAQYDAGSGKLVRRQRHDVVDAFFFDDRVSRRFQNREEQRKNFAFGHARRSDDRDLAGHGFVHDEFAAGPFADKFDEEADVSLVKTEIDKRRGGRRRFNRLGQARKNRYRE